MMNLSVKAVLAAVFLLMTCGAAAKELKPWNGGKTPALALKDLQGNVHDLAAYRGKVVLVNFWATWCEPCRDEMPSIEKLKARLAGRPFVVLAVNVDEPESRIRNFLTQLPLSFPVLVDYERKVTKAWGVRVLPATFVVGPGGGIRYSASGDLDWGTREIAERVAELFSAQ